MERGIAIQTEKVSKKYQLGVFNYKTLNAALQSRLARMRGREDPNRKITDRSAAGQNGEFWALKDVNITIYKGESVGIIGANGAGKSTLLKLISRVTAPTEGLIGINGRISSILEVGTGFNHELTGRENIYLNGAILGMTTAEVDAKIGEIIEFSECAQFIDTPLKRYSSGMFVKLAFAVAAHLNNEILIMDEVLAVGDQQFQKKCIDKMADASRTDGKTVLYVSHNMATIRSLCGRCIVLSHGKVVFDGDVEKAIEIYSQSYSEMRGRVALGSIHRTRRFDQRAVFLELSVPGKADPIFSYGEMISLCLKWRAISDISSASIVLRLMSGDGAVAASAFTGPELNAQSGETHETQLSVFAGSLCPGRYDITLFMLEKNTVDERICDVLDKCYCLDIVQQTAIGPISNWSAAGDGRAIMPQIEIVDAITERGGAE